MERASSATKSMATWFCFMPMNPRMAPLLSATCTVRAGRYESRMAGSSLSMAPRGRKWWVASTESRHTFVSSSMSARPRPGRGCTASGVFIFSPGLPRGTGPRRPGARCTGQLPSLQVARAAARLRAQTATLRGQPPTPHGRQRRAGTECCPRACPQCAPTVAASGQQPCWTCRRPPGRQFRVAAG